MIKPNFAARDQRASLRSVLLICASFHGQFSVDFTTNITEF